MNLVAGYDPCGWSGSGARGRPTAFPRTLGYVLKNRQFVGRVRFGFTCPKPILHKGSNLEGFACSKAVPILGRIVGKLIGEGMSAERSSSPWLKSAAVVLIAALRPVGESKIILPIDVHDPTWQCRVRRESPEDRERDGVAAPHEIPLACWVPVHANAALADQGAHEPA